PSEIKTVLNDLLKDSKNRRRKSFNIMKNNGNEFAADVFNELSKIVRDQDPVAKFLSNEWSQDDIGKIFMFVITKNPSWRKDGWKQIITKAIEENKDNCLPIIGQLPRKYVPNFTVPLNTADIVYNNFQEWRD